MGNAVVIPEKIREKFATSELKSMEKVFLQLSGSKKSFNRNALLKSNLFTYKGVASAVFKTLDRTNSNKVDIQQFFNGLYYLFKRTTNEKMKFIFVMVNVTISGSQSKISQADMQKFLMMDVFRPAEKNEKVIAKQVESKIHTIFKAFDLDQDRCLSETEFCNWGKDTSDLTPLLTELNRFEKLVLQSDEGGISGPTSVVHVSHVAKAKGGGISIDTIPDSWRGIFKSAGIKKSELEDPEIFEMLMQVISEQMAKTKNSQTTSSSPLISRSAKPRIENNDASPFAQKKSSLSSSSSSSSSKTTPTSPNVNKKNEDEEKQPTNYSTYDDYLNYYDSIDESKNDTSTPQSNNNDNINIRTSHDDDDDGDDDDEEGEYDDDLDAIPDYLPPSPPRLPEFPPIPVTDNNNENEQVAVPVSPAPIVVIPPVEDRKAPISPPAVSSPVPPPPPSNVPPPPVSPSVEDRKTLTSPPAVSSPVPPPPPHLGNTPKTMSLLDEIKGKKLNKIDTSVDKLSLQDKDDLTSALASAIMNHRVKMKMTLNSNYDDDEDESEDWD